MAPNLKSLGLAFLTALAVVVFAAPAAVANFKDTFTAGQENTVITAHGENHKFYAQKLTVVCKTATFAGKQSKKVATEITVHPNYSECVLSGTSTEVTVTTKGCNFILYSERTTNPVNPSELDAAIGTECEINHSIIVAGVGCAVYIGGNQVMHGVTYDHTSVKNKVVSKATASLIHYVAIGAFCALVGVETGTQLYGYYEGTSLVEGYEYLGIVEGSETNGTVFAEGDPVAVTVDTGEEEGE